ncbi:MAG: hypothetical protein GWN94_20690 [Phycisphaerae bacterium]|nr:hypothetical protein [Phycisphaerae bacterium]
MTILDKLAMRVDRIFNKTGRNPEFLEVSKEELHNYITLRDDLDPTYTTDDAGNVMAMVGEMPLKCTFRGIPLRCKDAG